jgi:hypothetical protein
MRVVIDPNNPYKISSLSPPVVIDTAPVSFPLRAVWGSLAVMLPWPMLGIAACLGLSLFEKSSEAIFMFGSVTMLFLLPLAFVEIAEWVFGVLVGIVWLLVLLLPLCFNKKSLHFKYHVELVFAGQSLFSAVQAGMGFLVVLGKYC